MTKEQLIEWRGESGNNQYQAARLLGVSHRQYQRYESGESGVPKLVGLILGCLDEDQKAILAETRKNLGVV